MDFLDAHHHQPNKVGIYNLNKKEFSSENYFSIGLHPKDITKQWKNDIENLKKISLSENCIAIGECGLDGLISINENLQNIVFLEQLKWAEEIKKPVIILCLRRFSLLLQYKKTKTPLIIHGFNKKESIAKEMLSAGFYLSFGKAALENLSLQKIIVNIPINKLFLETDNDNFEISKLYEMVATLKTISLENLKKQMWENLENITKHG